MVLGPADIKSLRIKTMSNQISDQGGGDLEPQPPQWSGVLILKCGQGKGANTHKKHTCAHRKTPLTPKIRNTEPEQIQKQIHDTNRNNTWQKPKNDTHYTLVDMIPQ